MPLTYTQTPPAAFALSWFMILGAAGAAFLLLVVPSAVVIIRADRHRRFGLGSLLRAVGSAWAKATVCVAIGLGVPFLAFGFTWLAHSRPGVSDAIWVVPGVVGGLSVLGATLLAGYLFTLGTNPKGLKPEHEPDDFDPAGRRGY